MRAAWLIDPEAGALERWAPGGVAAMLGARDTVSFDQFEVTLAELLDVSGYTGE